MSRWTEAWRWGEYGERMVRAWYTQQGYFVVPTSAIEAGGAPKLVGLLQAHVLPDMQAAQAGRVRWVEIKLKNSPVFHQISKTWRTGVDLRNWFAYLKVEQITGIPGELAMVHMKPGPRAPYEPKLLRAAFSDLRDVGQEALYPDNSRVMIWDVDRFERFDIVLDSPPDLPPLRKSVRPWEEAGADGTAPRMSPHAQGMLPW